MNLPHLSVRLKIGVIILVLAAVSLSIWGVKSGRLRIFAETTPQSISGKVFDRQGQPLSGVKIYDINKPAIFVHSRGDGLYNLANLPTGDLTISFEKHGTPFNPNFTDVATNYWAYREIGAIKNAGITSGYREADGTYSYRPSEPITRDQLSVFLVRALKLAPYHKATPSFKDVPANFWAYKEIEALVKEGIISGYPDGTFRPSESVNRGQLAVFLYRALKLTNNEAFPPSYSDVPTEHWAFREIETLSSEYIIMGYSDGTFGPDKTVTRDQMAVFLTRAFKNIVLTTGGYNPVFQRITLASNKKANLDIYLTSCGQVGKVFGQAKDVSGNVISSVEVILTLKPAIFEQYSRTTDSMGNFYFYNIPAGSYGYYVLKKDLTAVYQKTNEWENLVFVNAGEITTVDLSDLE